MLIVETIGRIRREHLDKGKSIREIVARTLHLSRNTVRRILRSGETASLDSVSSRLFGLGTIGRSGVAEVVGVRRPQYAPAPSVVAQEIAALLANPLDPLDP